MQRLRAWLRIAAHPRTVRRAGLTALVVGTVLTLVNHGAEIKAGSLGEGAVWPILVTFAIPFVVATVSTVDAIRSGRAGEAR